jgi:hypothetical protein
VFLLKKSLVFSIGEHFINMLTNSNLTTHNSKPAFQTDKYLNSYAYATGQSMETTFSGIAFPSLSRVIRWI